MTHVSNMLEDEWVQVTLEYSKTTQGKEALSGFVYIFCYGSFAERSCCHHTLRHLAELDVYTVISLICRDSDFGDWVDILTISSLDAISFRHVSTVNF